MRKYIGYLDFEMIFFDQLKNRLMYPAAYAYVSWQSKLSWLKSIGKKDQVRFSEPYAGQKIMLMALYEKGRIREDVVAAMAAARAQGVYVIGVNTLKLGKPEDYRSCMDCYIERYNFGRDFGSYKSGFEYIYSNGLAESCPCLLMINDSVFFSKKHISTFIENMLAGTVEVLGSTENFEIEHHLGSFCIAVNNSVLNNKKLKNYWQRYTCTDVRPVVIKTGEMELSKTLKKIISSSDNFRSLYDVTHVAEVLQSNPVVLDQVAQLSRRSDLVGWPRFSFAAVSKNIVAGYFHSSAANLGVGVNVDVDDISTVALHYANSVSQFHAFLNKTIANVELKDSCLEVVIKDEVISHFLDCFARGSQIHQNNVILHKIGLSIIKLDGVYRGMFNARDVEKLAEDLAPDQQAVFRRIMYSRPFGSSVLVGWKRAAFERGLI